MCFYAMEEHIKKMEREEKEKKTYSSKCRWQCYDDIKIMLIFFKVTHLEVGDELSH